MQTYVGAKIGIKAASEVMESAKITFPPQTEKENEYSDLTQNSYTMHIEGYIVKNGATQAKFWHDFVVRNDKIASLVIKN